MAKPNVKELVVNHFEKGIFVIVCLFAVVTLASTRWAPYARHPNEIKQLVALADEKIAAKTWPEEERQEFVVAEEQTVESLVQSNIRKQIDAAPYEFDVPFSHDILYGTTKPITEPEFYGMRALIADAGRFLMAVQPTKDEELTEDDPALMAKAADEEEDDQADVPEEFRTRKNNSPAAGLGGLAEYGGVGGAEYEEMQSAYLGGGAGYDDGAYGEEAYGEMGYGGMGMGMGSNVEGRGLRYVAVRGIVPIREQIRKYMKAINLRSFSQASSLYEIIDFELERQKMQPGDEPWSGEWEKVDIDIAIDTLNEALSFDPEVVQGSITDSAITMPLPGRLMGIWKSKATHPQLENFTLSPEEMEAELEFNRRLMKDYEEQQENEPQKVEKKGFSGIVVDSRSASMDSFGMDYEGAMTEEYDYEDSGDYGSMMGGINYAPTSKGTLTADAQKFLDKLKKEVGDSKENRDKALLEYITERITAQGELLLFRYFDFDVEPGATYKYRARLEVKNPNYDLPIAQVGGLQHIVEGQTRKSDWSNETEPVGVPQDVDYFVAKIDESSSGMPEARMAVFQWNPDYGTTIYDSVEMTLGEEVGGPKNTLVLDPAKSRFEVEPYTFHTGDVLVDALTEDSIPRLELREGGLHPDLKLPRSTGGAIGVSGQVLISQGNQELAVIDHLSRLKALEKRREYLEYERQPYEDIKQAEGQAASMDDMEAYGGFGEYMTEDSGMMEEMMGGYGGAEDYGKGRRRGSALRKRPGRTGGSSGGSSRSR